MLASGLFIYTKFGKTLYYDNKEWIYYSLNIFGVILTIVCIIACLTVGSDLSQRLVIDEKIALYETENKAIEEDISLIVSQYQNYELEAFENLKPDNVIAAVGMYPELKTNQLVSKQIDLYVQNNEEIKALKRERLNYKVLAWWLYFGK